MPHSLSSASRSFSRAFSRSRSRAFSAASSASRAASRRSRAEGMAGTRRIVSGGEPCAVARPGLRPAESHRHVSTTLRLRMGLSKMLLLGTSMAAGVVGAVDAALPDAAAAADEADASEELICISAPDTVAALLVLPCRIAVPFISLYALMLRPTLPGLEEKAEVEPFVVDEGEGSAVCGKTLPEKRRKSDAADGVLGSLATLNKLVLLPGVPLLPLPL